MRKHEKSKEKQSPTQTHHPKQREDVNEGAQAVYGLGSQVGMWG